MNQLEQREMCECLFDQFDRGKAWPAAKAVGIARADFDRFHATWKSRRERRANGIQPPKGSMMPPNFADFAATMTNVEIGDRYGVHPTTVSTWRAVVGIPAPSKISSLPKEVLKLAPLMTVNQLGERFNVNPRTIRDFLKKHCVTAKCGKVPPPRSGVGFRAASVPTRAMTFADRAASYLQRFGPVYRCNERGHADIVGKFYNRGGRVLTPAEIIERAERQGWNADPLRKVA